MRSFHGFRRGKRIAALAQGAGVRIASIDDFEVPQGNMCGCHGTGDQR